MIEVLKQSAERIWYAGDDDQAIHAWNGVDVTNFMNSCENIRILNQSFRVPTSVHKLANKIVLCGSKYSKDFADPLLTT